MTTPELTPLQILHQMEKDFVMLATMHTNHLNGREVALAKTNMEQAVMWFERALEKHHTSNTGNAFNDWNEFLTKNKAGQPLEVPVADSATDKGAI